MLRHKALEVRAPVGAGLTCKGWHQEAAMRCLMNSLDPDVAELPGELIVGGGCEKVARNWECYTATIEALRRLENDETLLVQSGKPVGLFRTHAEAPRLLIANSNLVGKWARWSEFRRLEALDLMMYGSWMYTGSQGALQSSYELLAACGERHFGGDLFGRMVVSGGMGSLGGTLSLASTMLGGHFLGVDVDRRRIQRRIDFGYCDLLCEDLDDALHRLGEARTRGEPLSIGLVGNIARVIPNLVERGIVPDIVTDLTAAHDLRHGYYPLGLGVEEADSLRDSDPEGYDESVLDSMAKHVEGLLALQRAGSIVFDYGNNLRGQVADHRGMNEAFEIPGFVSEYLRPLFCRGVSPLSWVALSGNPQDIDACDQEMLHLFPNRKRLHHWLHKVREKFSFQGLPTRTCWLEHGEQAEMGLRMNWLAKEGLVEAPIAIGRNQFECGSSTSPNGVTEGVRDGTDAVADWTLLNALLNTACGASWVSIHHGAGEGIGYAHYSNVGCLVDGTDEADRRLDRVLHADSGTGIMRHADAGYPEALRLAEERNMDLPMITNREV